MANEPKPAPQKFIVTGIDIPFWDLVVVLVKLSLASIPAFLILTFLGRLFTWIVRGFLGDMGMGH